MTKISWWIGLTSGFCWMTYPALLLSGRSENPDTPDLKAHCYVQSPQYPTPALHSTLSTQQSSPCIRGASDMHDAEVVRIPTHAGPHRPAQWLTRSSRMSLTRRDMQICPTHMRWTRLSVLRPQQVHIAKTVHGSCCPYTGCSAARPYCASLRVAWSRLLSACSY